MPDALGVHLLCDTDSPQPLTGGTRCELGNEGAHLVAQLLDGCAKGAESDRYYSKATIRSFVTNLQVFFAISDRFFDFLLFLMCD
jgi:hypothetical protein